MSKSDRHTGSTELTMGAEDRQLQNERLGRQTSVMKADSKGSMRVDGGPTLALWWWMCWRMAMSYSSSRS